MISEKNIAQEYFKALILEADISILYYSKGKFQMDIRPHRNV